MMGFEGCNQSVNSSDDFITVKVNTNYPKKELILQDFMDVEYIPLETTDEFVCSGLVEAMGEDIIIVRNHNHINRDGNIYIFDRNGKALRKINRKGQGGEEYLNIFGIALDEDNSEIFVNDVSGKKILVYDLDGKFNRSFKHQHTTKYYNIYNFDRENLICYENPPINNNDGSTDYKGQSFMIISKQDGSITKEIQIPFEEKKSIWAVLVDEKNNMVYSQTPDHYPMIPDLDSWILVEPSADTIYRYFPNHKMEPFIVRTPSVRSEPDVFLFPSILTDRYYFMESVKKTNDFDKAFSGTDMIYDRQEKAIFQYTVYNGDFSEKKEKRKINMHGLKYVSREIMELQSLEPFELIESYQKGELKGKLKEIAATLDEDDNPVIMLIKHKK
jgi:cytochrome oxidase Cu insertion factor (SCO1/SenC/PrrC family)